MTGALLVVALSVFSHHRLVLQPNLPRTFVTPPLFEFAPSSGFGMGTACACSAAITGARGEAVTFTRASNAYCTKGNEWSSIAVGDLVQCSTDQPLVMPGGAGTGPLGTLEEDSGANVLTQPEDFTHADWANFTAGAGTNPTKGSADTDAAPNGATTAEKVTFNATASGDSSALSQANLTAAAYSGSLYAKGNATTNSGTFDVCIDTVASATCMSCSYVLSTYTRCPLENITSKASGKFYIGNLTSLNGGTTRSQQTVTLWGAQAEQKAIVTSYMGTGRSRASSALLIAFNVPPSGGASIAGSMVLGPTNFTGETLLAFAPDPASSVNFYNITWAANAVNTNFRIDNISNSHSLAGTPTAAASNRFSGAYDTVNVTGCMNGTCGSTAKSITLFSGAVTFLAGRRQGVADTFHANRVVKQVCFDPSPLKCR